MKATVNLTMTAQTMPLAALSGDTVDLNWNTVGETFTGFGEQCGNHGTRIQIIRTPDSKTIKSHDLKEKTDSICKKKNIKDE